MKEMIKISWDAWLLVSFEGQVVSILIALMLIAGIGCAVSEIIDRREEKNKTITQKYREGLLKK